MNKMYKTGLTAILLVFTTILSFGSSYSQQPFMLSKSSDFSSDDRAFSTSDTLFILVNRPDIDYTNLKDMEYRLKARNDGIELRGTFVNHMDGTYSAAIDLSAVNPNQIYWELRIEIEDNAENKLDVRVPITITADGSAPAQPGMKYTEIRGVISDVQDGKIKVRGVWISVNDQTQIMRGNMNLASSDLKAGMWVEVKGTVQDDGSILATRIMVKQKMGGNDDEVEVKGFISAIGPDSLVVDGITFWVDATTKIRDREERMIQLSNLKVGDFVEIQGRVRNDGKIWAERIQMEDDEGFEGEYDLKGPIQALTDSSITVAGVEFLVDENTEVKGEDYEGPIGFSALEVGAIVEVEGQYRNDGRLWAKKISLEDSPKDELEVKGIIESFDGDSFVVDNLTFKLDSTTVILGDDRARMDASALQVGLYVEVKAFRQNDGTLLAVRIKIEDEFKSKIEVKGEIQELTANTIKVFNMVFDVDSNTVVLGHDKTLLTLADLQVGMVVEVKALVRQAGNPYAEKIKVEERYSDEVEVNAAIDSLTEGRVYAGGLEFLVNDNTIILNAQKQPISFADLKVGDYVEIKGRRLPDGTNLALRIKLEDSPVAGMELKGTLNQIAGDTIVVEQTPILTDANTQFYDENGNAITLADFNVGETVEVKAVAHMGGGWLAVRVEKEEPVSMQGQVQAVVNGQMTVLNTVVQITENTLIVGPFNVPLTDSAIQEGANVIVEGSVSPSGDVVASTVVVSTDAVTGVADPDVAALPEAFVLEQNYPNPFNPETTLRYRIQTRSPQRVVLTIYNLMGQQVATLVNRVQPAGSYSITWNGRSDAGHVLPSGIYFAKLQVGKATQVRRMVLSK